MKLGIFLPLALCLATSCGSSDPATLANDGSAALSAGKYPEAVKSFEGALAGMDASSPDWMRVQLGLVQALAHTDATRGKTEFLALAKANPSKVSDRDFSMIGLKYGEAGKLNEATEILNAGMEMHAESPQLIQLRDRLGDLAKEGGSSDALKALEGLGYAGGD
jgi:hypothetical protein